jgi:hypothetical protein
VKFNRNTQRNKAVITLVGLVLWWSALFPEICTALDAYIVYDRKNHQEKERFLAALPKELTHKSYNISRLNGGDYSEKQKILIKFKKASVVVFIFDGPMKALSGSTLNSDLIIVQSLLPSVKSKARTLYVLSQDMDSAQLEQQLRTLHRTAEVVRVKEETIDIITAAALLTAKISNQQ